MFLLSLAMVNLNGVGHALRSPQNYFIMLIYYAKPSLFLKKENHMDFFGLANIC